MKSRVIINIVFTILLTFMFSAKVCGDTFLIHSLDILDIWTNNYNASHWIEQGNLRSGTSMYGEEFIEIKNVPDQLVGADWIQTAYGSKSYKGDTLVMFSLSYDANIYIIHYKGIQQKPLWLSEYQKEEGIFLSSQGEFEVYKKKCTKGERISLGNNGSSTDPMYIVAATPSSQYVSKKLVGKNILDVTELGAKGDDVTVNTEVLQKAIDRCSQMKNGGTVYIQGGIYRTGTLELKDNVTLHVEKGAILRGTANMHDYSPKRIQLPSFRANEDYQLLFAENKSNITITGGGIIDGYSIGEGWPFKGKGNEDERPRLIRMVSCQNINLKGITLIRSGNWTQYYEACRDMNFDRVNVRCYTGSHNQDGIDLSGCSNVKLTNFNAICGDDVVCFKAMSLVPAENILVEGVFSRYANCNIVKIGTETHGNIKNLTVRNVEGTARYGVAIEAVDGSVLENILYENFLLHSCASPLFIRLGNRGRTFEGGPNPSPVGQIKNVTIRNIRNTDIGYVEVRNGPGVGSVISGLKDQKIENLLIEDCDFLYYGSVRDKYYVYRDIPENEEKYPEFNLVGTCPAYGLYFRHISGLKCNNVTLHAKYPDIRPAIVLENVNDPQMDNVHCESFTITEPHTIWNKK